MSENLLAVVVRMSPTQVVIILLACTHIGRGQGKGKRQVCRGKDKTIFKVKNKNINSSITFLRYSRRGRVTRRAA